MIIFGGFKKRNPVISAFVNIKGVVYAGRERRYLIITGNKDILSIS